VIGFEMFPRQVQPALDRWVAGELSVPALLAQTAWEENWSFPIEFYLPLFEFARINRIPMLALNVDARLTRAIGDKGWDAIPEREREGVGRAAPASEAYRDFLFSVYGEHAHGQGARSSSGFQYFVEAQQNWDRAMAEALAVRRVRERRGGPAAAGRRHHGQRAPALRFRRAAPVARSRRRACRHAAAVVARRGLPRDSPGPRRRAVRLAEEAGDAGAATAPRRATRRRRRRAGRRARAGRHRRQSRREERARRRRPLLEVAGRPTLKAGAVIATVRAAPPGTWLPLRVRRGEATLEIVIRFPPHHDAASGLLALLLLLLTAGARAAPAWTSR
jgi:hypothetical protein